MHSSIAVQQIYIWYMSARKYPHIAVGGRRMTFMISFTRRRLMTIPRNHYMVAFGQTLSFCLVMDEVTRDRQVDIPWCMLFTDDVLLVDGSLAGVNRKLEMWHETLESKGFRLWHSAQLKLNIRDVTLLLLLTRRELLVFNCRYCPGPGSIPFRYLGSMPQRDRDIDEDVSHRSTWGG